MEHDQVSALLSDVRARPSDADWVAIDQHMQTCTDCGGALALFGATVAGELALLRFELAGHASFFAGPAAFGLLGTPLLLGVIATTLILSRGGSGPPTLTPTPSPTLSPTATAAIRVPPSSTPTLTVTPEATPTAPARPTAMPELPSATVASGPNVAGGDCESFSQRQPASGADVNHEIEDTIVSLENDDRQAHGLANLIPDQALYQVAAGYARMLVETRWWDQVGSGRQLHTGPDGSTLQSRLRAGGISDWRDDWENLGYSTDIIDGCYFFAHFTPNHVLNYLGHSEVDRSVVYPTLYHGTACYIDYEQRLVACVQDLIAR